MSEKTLKFDNVTVNKKGFYASEKYITLNLVDIAEMVISDKFKHNGKGFKYFIGYKNAQMNEYINFFDNNRKNISFLINDDSLLIKHDEIWNKIKKMLSIKFHCVPVYDENYLKI